MAAVLVVLVVLVALMLSIVGASVRVLREYERGVVFRFGRLVAQKGPGLVLLVPIADRMVRVSLRTITHTIPRRTSLPEIRQPTATHGLGAGAVPPFAAEHLLDRRLQHRAGAVRPTPQMPPSPATRRERPISASATLLPFAAPGTPPPTRTVP